MLAGEDGTVYAGTAPEGFVYRIDANGAGDILFDAEELYVWDLAMGPDGMIYAAVGPDGAVYRIDPESGESSRFYETSDHHVVCLAFDEAGNLLLGTEGRGLVVRVAPDGTARVLHDCPESEVGAVLPGRDGEVWAAAAAAAPVREEATRPDESPDGTDLENNLPIEYTFEITPSTAGDGVLYRIDAEGNAFVFWESGQAAIFDLAWSESGTILATTGEEGALYELDDSGRPSLLHAADEIQVVSIEPAGGPGDGWVLATANPSRVVRASAGFGIERDVHVRGAGRPSSRPVGADGMDGARARGEPSRSRFAPATPRSPTTRGRTGARRSATGRRASRRRTRPASSSGAPP